jgi:nucleotide-binding universal stress UspA family protein
MYKKLMVPLDGSELAECVIPHVDEFAADCKVDSIIFVKVIEDEPLPIMGSEGRNQLDKFFEYRKKSEGERKSRAQKYLDELIEGRKQGDILFQTEVLVGKVEDRLLEYAEGNKIDLILIATHGRSGVSRWVRGSVAERILQGSRIPVLMVRAPGTVG